MNKIHFNTVDNCTKHLGIRALPLFYLGSTKKNYFPRKICAKSQKKFIECSVLKY